MVQWKVILTFLILTRLFDFGFAQVFEDDFSWLLSLSLSLFLFLSAKSFTQSLTSFSIAFVPGCGV